MIIRNSKGATAEVSDELAESQGVRFGEPVRDSVFLALVKADIEMQLRRQREKDEDLSKRPGERFEEI